MDPLATGQEYYSENYANYEAQTPREKLDFYLKLLGRHVPNGRTIFELGVAMGHFLERASLTYNCQGSDINSFGVETAKKKCPTATLAVGSFEQIPTGTDLSAVVSWDVLKHLPDIRMGLSTIYTRLPKGGLLVGVVPIYDGALGWLVRRLDTDPTHVIKVGRGDWHMLLKEQGFEVIESGGILRKLLGQKYFHFTKPQPILRHCCSALYFVAKK